MILTNDDIICPECKLRVATAGRLYCGECDRRALDRIHDRRRAMAPKCVECETELSRARARVTAYCTECASSAGRAASQTFNKMAKQRNPLEWIEGEGTDAERRKARQWLKRNPSTLSRLQADNSRLRARCTNYGITVADWVFLAAAQDGRCGICATPNDDPIALVVDHDHATGGVRGLLCYGCNAGLGGLKIDGDDALRRAQAIVGYIEAFHASRKTGKSIGMARTQERNR